jgi:multidrug transporter EmrE-like cation transporter
MATPRVQCCSLLSLEFEPRSEARYRSLHPWLRLGYSVALSFLSSSSLVQRLGVARYTIGCASGAVLLSQLSRFLFRGSLSPPPWLRLGLTDAFSTLPSLVRKLAVVCCCTLGSASGVVILSALSSLVQRLAVARCTVGCARLLVMLYQISRASFKGSLALAVHVAAPPF